MAENKSENEVGAIGQSMADQLVAKVIGTVDGFPSSAQERAGIAEAIAAKLSEYATVKREEG